MFSVHLRLGFASIRGLPVAVVSSSSIRGSRFFLRQSAFICGLSVLVRVHLRLRFVLLRGIETFNDLDESLFHRGIRKVGRTDAALEGVRGVESDELPAID